MAFQFPEDKQDFKAPNGITYTYYDGAWMVKSYGEKLDLSSYVQQDVFDADQSRQDTEIANEAAINETQSDQINLLETQIQLLAKAQVAGRWNYVRNISGGSVRPPATKTFFGTHTDGAEVVLRDWVDARLLMISKTDLTDTVYTFTDFEEGDKVEILATDGSSACYGTVTNQPTQEAYGNLVIAVERSTSGPRDDKEYILSVYRPGAVGGEVDLDILDGRYLVKTGDTMTGQLKLEQTQLAAVKADGTQQYKINPNAGDYYTNIYSFNCADGGGGVRLRVTPGNNTEGYKTFLQATFKDNIIDGTNHGVETQLNWLRTPTANHHAANKQYVDDAVDGAAGMVLNLWTYRGQKNSSSGLNDGEFGSKKMADGVLELYLAEKNSQGQIYHPTRPNSTAEYYHQITDSRQEGSPMTVTDKYGRCLWYAETKKIVFNKGGSSGVMVEAIKYRAQFDNLVDGDQYMLNVAGFLSPVSGWS